LILGHFVFFHKEDSEKTASDLVDILDREIENNPSETGLSDPELSTTRRFNAHVTTDKTEDEIKLALQTDNPAEFEILDNFYLEDGKVFFDIETDRNVGIRPVELEKMIDTGLGATDAVVTVPGGNKLPLKPFVGTIYLNVTTTEAKAVLDDWTNEIASEVDLFTNLPGWTVDYHSAFNDTAVQIFAFAEFPYSKDTAEIKSVLEAQPIEYRLSAPRSFVGRCSYTGAPIPDPRAVNSTISKLGQGMTIPDLVTVTVTYIALKNTVGNDTVLYNLSNRRKRQAEEEDEQPVYFRFYGGESERLIPGELQVQGREIIKQNPTLANVLNFETLIIEPEMYDPVKGMVALFRLSRFTWTNI
jgi:hypothetical protein